MGALYPSILAGYVRVWIVVVSDTASIAYAYRCRHRVLVVCWPCADRVPALCRLCTDRELAVSAARAPACVPAM